MSEEDKKRKINIDMKTAIIGLLLILSIGTNIYLSYSIMQMHAFTMQFVSDVFYYTPNEESSPGVVYDQDVDSMSGPDVQLEEGSTTAPEE